jgi:hypothetical protein
VSTVTDSDAPAFAAAINKSPFSGRHKKGGAGPRERKVATSISADRDFVAAQEGEGIISARHGLNESISKGFRKRRNDRRVHRHRAGD